MTKSIIPILAAGLLLAGCNAQLEGGRVIKPSFAGTVTQTSYDGNSDDLLTAGLGKSGLASSTAPSAADPTHPTAAELRRLAIYSNYRARVDTTGAGGYGVLYGPNVDSAGNAGNGEGKIAGVEYRTYSDDGSNNRNVTLVVQVPDTFDSANPCIVSATSPGALGVYGAISTGEWGLKRRCAVAYTDKGGGAAPHDLQNDTVPLIDGTRTTSSAAGVTAAFKAPMTAAERVAFNNATPNRFAFKHAHSQLNPEKDWGLFTLQAIEFGFYAINDRYGKLDSNNVRTRSFVPKNTIVIASSVGNGGAAALAAAEQDSEAWIDGVAVAEPAVELPANPGVTVRRGNTVQATIARPVMDFVSYAALLQVCASMASELSGTPRQPDLASFNNGAAQARCVSLRNRGLISGGNTQQLAADALAKLRAYGWERESAAQYASLSLFELPQAVAVSTANSLLRASVRDNLCGYSYANSAVDNRVGTLGADALALMYGTGNGRPPTPTTGTLLAPSIQLFNNRNASGAGPLRDLVSVSASSGLNDWNYDGALCLRSLITDADANAQRLQAGLDETRRSGNLRGLPAVIVHGRDDAMVPVNHSSRPYYALNKRVDLGSQLSYIEVTNAQHFDAFIGDTVNFGGYDVRYVPLTST